MTAGPTPDWELYHSGVIVDDLDESMATLGRAAGLAWLPPLTSTTVFWTPRGDMRMSLRWTYSDGPGHRVELIEQVPSADLSVPELEMPRRPHLGYWVDDADRARAHLEEAGLPTCFARLSDADGTTLVSYHDNTAGPLVEVVSRKVQTALGSWMSGAGWRGLET